MKRTPAPSPIRALAMTVGVAAAVTLVWFVGPLVTIAGVAPLAGESARRIAVVAVVAFALACVMWRAARAGRINRRLMEGLLAPAADSGDQVPGAKEVAVLGERFEHAVALLKRRRMGAGRSLLGVLGARPYIYELPWYVIIGAPGAGKTTALINSGLEFPLEAQIGGKMVRGVGGTRNCDWWFTSDAVLIDTAGRYTTQDSDQAADSHAWRGFLDLLVRYRPRASAEAYLRLRTLQGEQAQVDWAHFGSMPIGRARRPLMAFVMVLSYSRHLFVRFYLNATMSRFRDAHVQAFGFFNAVPRVCLYDNLRSAVLECVGDAIRFHPRLLELSA